MKRPPRARRFEPRFGVSRLAIDAEAQYLAREVEDYRTYSLSELREKLQERRSTWKQVDASVAHLVPRLPERERLILQCLLVRDVRHVLELYLTHLRSHAPEETPPLQAAPTAEVPPTPFSECLFGSE